MVSNQLLLADLSWHRILRNNTLTTQIEVSVDGVQFFLLFLGAIRIFGAEDLSRILFGSDYWQGFLDWMRKNSLAEGYISEEDFNLLRVCQSSLEVADVIQLWYQKHRLTGKQAITR